MAFLTDAKCCKCGRNRPLVNVRRCSCAECFVASLSRTFASNLRSKCVSGGPRALALYIPGDVYSLSLLHLLLVRNLRRLDRSSRRRTLAAIFPFEDVSGGFLGALRPLLDGRDLEIKLLFAIDGIDGCGSTAGVDDDVGDVFGDVDPGDPSENLGEPRGSGAEPLIPRDFFQNGRNYILSLLAFLNSTIHSTLPSTKTPNSSPPIALDDAIVASFSDSSLNIAYIRPCFLLHLGKRDCDDDCGTLIRRLTQCYTQSDDSRSFATLLIRRWNFIALKRWFKSSKGVDIGALATADVMEDVVANVLFNTCIGASSRVPRVGNFVENLSFVNSSGGFVDCLQWYRPLVSMSRLEIDLYWKLQVANQCPGTLEGLGEDGTTLGFRGRALDLFGESCGPKNDCSASKNPGTTHDTRTGTNSCNSITTAVCLLLEAIEKAAEKPPEVSDESKGCCGVNGAALDVHDTLRGSGAEPLITSTELNNSRESRAPPLNPKTLVGSSTTSDTTSGRSRINNTLCNIVRVTNRLVDPPSATVCDCDGPLVCRACLYRIGSSELDPKQSPSPPTLCKSCKYLSKRYDSLALLFDSLGMCT